MFHIGTFFKISKTYHLNTSKFRKHNHFLTTIFPKCITSFLTSSMTSSSAIPIPGGPEEMMSLSLALGLDSPDPTTFLRAGEFSASGDLESLQIRGQKVLPL